MKASELAELLLQTPDEEVYFVTAECDRDGDYYYHAHSIKGKEHTPDGLFLTHDSLWRHNGDFIPRMPCDTPSLGYAKIKLKNRDPDYQLEYYPEEDTYSEDNTSSLHTLYFWREIQVDGYQMTYHDDGCAVLIYSKEPEYMDDDAEVFKVDDIEHVEVITSVHPDTWEVETTIMTFQEAYDFCTDLLQSNK